uniref:Proteasome prosome macropain subunit beta n=1 Tax=Echinococcus granulosus TaxID=6210 RepID=A0A068WKP1_ECHGR|nr:proteasome prosome macropain subunit beta [Echinococcus granulosus]
MEFNPYTLNGGTALGISGKDFALVASDTRLTDENMGLLFSRDSPHIYEVTSNVRICLTGFHGDIITFIKLLESHIKEYLYQHKREIPLTALANLVSVCLYSRRFFPFYVSAILAGIDEDGRGAIFSFDPVGSYEREVYRACGTGGAILQPFMDSQIGGPDLVADCVEMEKGPAVRLARDVFISATERDIYCGDSVVIDVITASGVNRVCYPLRRD